MPFNDTSTKQGIIQDIEFWTNLGDGAISGNALLKAQFTRLVNVRYARTLAKLQLASGRSGAEDTNYADQQFSLFDIQSGINDYQFLTDEDGNTITDITGVLILPTATATDYVPLDRLALSDRDALLIMSPNASKTGTPKGYIEKNNTVFFDRLPDYSSSNGGKVFYRLVPSYFAATDTTKTPGFAEGYHRILPLGAAHDWLSINRPDNQVLITRVESELATMNDELDAYTRQRNPTNIRMTGAHHSSR